jgi:hypothetical protein
VRDDWIVENKQHDLRQHKTDFIEKGGESNEEFSKKVYGVYAQ